MSAKVQIDLTNSFADESTRKITLGTFDMNATNVNVTNLRNTIKSINSDVSNIENLYLSDSGAKFTGITGAVININEKTIFI